MKENYQQHWQWGQWEGYRRVVPPAYRTIAFAIATTQIFFFAATYDFVIPPMVIVIAIGIYTLAKALYPLRWYGRDALSHTLFGADTAICIFLLRKTLGSQRSAKGLSVWQAG